MAILRTTVLIEASRPEVEAVLEPATVTVLGRPEPVRTRAVATGAGTLLTCTVCWRRFGHVIDTLVWRRSVITRLTAVGERVRARCEAGP